MAVPLRRPRPLPPLLLLAGGALARAGATATSRPPNLIHIVGDDIGWHDLGISNPDLRTPRIDGLIRGGVQLTRFYAQKECAPSRSAIMTGRLPFRYGYYENPSDDGGIPTNYTLLPQVLRARGYRTHAIGKWHCGFRTPGHTPTHRGFDSFLGYWHWGEEYVDHAFPPYYKTGVKCRGLDLTKAQGSEQGPLFGLNGTRSTSIFVGEFERVLTAHPAGVPLYVYLAFQNAHDPYEKAPPGLVAGYSPELGPNRRNFSAIVEDLDNGVGEVVRLLREHGLWENTVLWFTSDNGGELPFADQRRCGVDGCLTTACCGGAGSNWPLRGGKFTLYEGGIRSRSFIYSASPLIPAALRGSEWAGLSHVADIFATMAGLAGASILKPPDSMAVGLGDRVDLGGGSALGALATDGYDLWRAIVSNGTSPRQELLHQPINVYWNGTCTEGDRLNPFTPSCGASITILPYKLFIGFPGDARVVVTPSPGAPPGVARGDPAPRGLCELRPCLYNVVEDPSEAHDLAAELPDVVNRLTARLHELSAPQAAPQPPDALTPLPSDAACRMVTSTGAWQPWDREPEQGLEEVLV